MFNIYLAGAMENVSNEEAKNWREVTKSLFADSSVRCISPVDYYLYDSNDYTNDSEVFRFDLHMIDKSDVVLVNLSNLRKSVGTCDEILYSYMNDIPVIGFLTTDDELSEEDIKKEIHVWKYIQINRVETGKDAFKKAVDYIKYYYCY